MAKFLVRRGKVSRDGETYVKGDVFEMTVKESEKFPKSMLERVLPTAPPAPPEKPPEKPSEVDDPVETEEEEEPKRVTI